MYKGHRFFYLIIATIIAFSASGCKKEIVCSEVKADIDGVSVSMGCLPISGSTLDSSYFTLNTNRPTQSVGKLYDVSLHFKNEIGVQILDTASNHVFSGAYIRLYKNCCGYPKTYSLYHSGTNGNITVTRIDESAKIVEGTFSATLCEKDSVNDCVQITGGSFSTKYQ